MRKGSILFHPSFEFTNGEIGRKYLVILNTPDIKKIRTILILQNNKPTTE